MHLNTRCEQMHSGERVACELLSSASDLLFLVGWQGLLTFLRARAGFLHSKLRGLLRRKHAGSPEDAGRVARSATGESCSLLPVEVVGAHAQLGESHLR
jgi:hypothetical protein